MIAFAARVRPRAISFGSDVKKVLDAEAPWCHRGRCASAAASASATATLPRRSAASSAGNAMPNFLWTHWVSAVLAGEGGLELTGNLLRAAAPVEAAAILHHVAGSTKVQPSVVMPDLLDQRTAAFRQRPARLVGGNRRRQS